MIEEAEHSIAHF